MKHIAQVHSRRIDKGHACFHFNTFAMGLIIVEIELTNAKTNVNTVFSATVVRNVYGEQPYATAISSAGNSIARVP